MFKFKKLKIIFFTALLVTTLIFSFYITGFSSTDFKKGFPAPYFSAKNIEGKTFNLEDWKEKQKLLIL